MIKTINAFLLVVCLFIGDASQTPSQDQERQYNCAANMLSMNSRLCMDMSEVPVTLWKTFLRDMKAKYGEESQDYFTNLPNFKSWEKLFPGNTAEKLSRIFMNEEQLDLMPIVGISHQQARRFCAWRTQKFKEELAQMKPKERANFPKDFRFRLPTAKEWVRIQFMTQDKRMIKQIAKVADANSKMLKLKRSELLNSSFRIASVYENQDPLLGLFNVFGNVAEMTDLKGKAMGGSWNQRNADKVWEKQFDYYGPSSWLGFRCIFEIIE